MTDIIHTQPQSPANGASATSGAENVRTAMTADGLRRAIEDHLRYSLGRPDALLEPKHYYRSLSLAVRDRLPVSYTHLTLPTSYSV